MSVSAQSDFDKHIGEAFALFRPKKIIETGTYRGMGTTAIIARQIKELEIEGAQFFSIEINPDFCSEAIRNLTQLGLYKHVNIMNGLSIRREQLPTPEEIEEKFVKETWPQKIYIDHHPNNRVAFYHRETHFPGPPDNLLFECLKKFEFKPDFVLLDSGGHIGGIEFALLISCLQGPCIIALDDVFHVKHYHNFLKMINDNRFSFFRTSREKFGHCITCFTPRAKHE